jgi:hypothetical protein
MDEKEYIERSALIKDVRGLTTETWGKGLKNGWWSHSVQIKDNFLRLIEKSPAADVVEVRHGEWIEKPYLLGTTRYCSRCGENYGMPHGIYNYCPHCGAKMDGGKTD